MGQFRTREQEGNMQFTLLAICVVACVSGQRSGRQEPVAVYDQYQGAASDDSGALASDDPLAGLTNNIPGVPGEDYPIYSEVPETAFACDGQVDGGYYADSEAECQVFHICTADGAGGLAKYSFLCPNGTLFNQNYFICDWWFNFDCSTAVKLLQELLLMLLVLMEHRMIMLLLLLLLVIILLVEQEEGWEGAGGITEEVKEM